LKSKILILNKTIFYLGKIMPSKNKLNKIVSNINVLPEFLRSKALSTFFGTMVKFTGTAGIIIEELNDQKAVISLKNKKAVQNHIGSVHAVASILIAESASGYVVGMNIPDSSVPVIKTIKADYTKRAKGDMKAVASLTKAQISSMRTKEKGETSVKVTVTDGEGKEPIIMEMIWAWTPKKR
jgi:acyl-coenzyme A thioesterase PaaI-like protein